jgi:hypothetical protein
MLRLILILTVVSLILSSGRVGPDSDCSGSAIFVAIVC